MTTQDAVTLASCAALGAAAAATLGGVTAAVMGAGTGVVFALVANRFQVRAAVAVAVFTGTVVGTVLGRGIVHVLCLPGSCLPMEITAALLLGAGAFVGVGLVAALVTRSFDEFRGQGP